ncbi:MAG: hypothetical protein ABI670_05570 [Chloroflexota bacterium]
MVKEPPQQSRWTRIHSILLGVIVAILLLTLLESFGPISGSVRTLISPRRVTLRPQSSGPSAGWADMLALAREEAAKADKEAIPGEIFVQAAPAGDSSLKYETFTGYTGSLTLSFQYISSSGSETYIEFEDANPAATITHYNSDEHAAKTYLYSRANKRQTQIADGIASIKISPRQAMERTWQAAQEEARAAGLTGVTVVPSVISLWIEQDGSASWFVQYTGKDLTRPTPTSAETRFHDAEFSTHMTVSAVTGEITGRSSDGK